MSWVNVDTYELPAGSVWAGMPAYEGDFNLKWNLESYEWGLFSGGEQKYLYDPEWDKWRRIWPEGTVEVQRWEETPDFDAYIEPEYTEDWSQTIWPGLEAGIGGAGQTLQDVIGVDLGSWWNTLKTYGPLVILGIIALAFIWFTKGRK